MTAVSIARGIAVCLIAAALGACVVEPARYPPPPQAYSPPPPADNGYDAEAAVTAQTAPPPMPVYEQPPIPGDGYMWTPGYWNYAGGDYFWVPGTWVQPPRVGVLWTPGYWAIGIGAVYAFHAGYWGPQ